MLQGSGEAHRLYLRTFGWHWVLVSLLLYLAVSAISLTQDGILSMLMGEAKTVQDLEEWRELRNSRLRMHCSDFCKLGCIEVRCHRWDCAVPGQSNSAGDSARLRACGSGIDLCLQFTYRPPYDWPQHGEVKFRSFESEASSNCTLALRGINLTILKGERIGVISREKTGTDGLVSCLFRSVEARSSAVLIDDVKIARMGLHDLRSHLQIISQVPVLFSGPLRTNLDPLSQYTDAQMWLALELCHLKERVRLLPAQLLHRGPPSLSDVFGQRRLLCLARALLARVRILLVEEALPCVDLETEDLVQQLIHTEFKDCTVLWLTQNPLTVMHRVLVLNKGRAVNFDTPSTLLQQGPLFSQ